jgi:hypothetical protein
LAILGEFGIFVYAHISGICAGGKVLFSGVGRVAKVGGSVGRNSIERPWRAIGHGIQAPKSLEIPFDGT